MAADDYAILTGISWYPAGSFTELMGPLNDVALVQEWLSDPRKGAVPPERIRTVLTPAPKPTLADPWDAQPAPQQFNTIFEHLIDARMKLGSARQKGRLYLYFSGHGFSSRNQFQRAEAALYCANATQISYPHLFGTSYATFARSWGLFSEIVLIMDCCRDTDSARVPIPPPYRDTPSDGMAVNTRLLEIYAVPKGGGAPERLIPERHAVHGLLTHALFKLLDELPASGVEGVSATALKEKLLAGWKAISGENALHPEVYLPGNGEMYFQTGAVGSPLWFSLSEPAPEGCILTLRDGRLQAVASFDLHQKMLVGDAAPALMEAVFSAMSLQLRLAHGMYQYILTGPVAPLSGAVAADGSKTCVQL